MTAKAVIGSLAIGGAVQPGSRWLTDNLATDVGVFQTALNGGFVVPCTAAPPSILPSTGGGAFSVAPGSVGSPIADGTWAFTGPDAQGGYTLTMPAPLVIFADPAHFCTVTSFFLRNAAASYIGGALLPVAIPLTNPLAAMLLNVSIYFAPNKPMQFTVSAAGV
jgi:hypothetical protein